MRPTALILLAVALVAVPAAPVSAGEDPVILDLHADGIDLSGSTTSDLLGNPAPTVRWTVPNTDDCWLMVDASSIQAAGYLIRDENDVLLEGLTMVRGGLLVTFPGGTGVRSQGPFGGRDMLSILDENNDGRIDDQDPVWAHLWLFMDTEGDGRISAVDTLHRPETVQFRSIDLSGGDPYTDSSGNQRSDGSWFDDGGAQRVYTSVILQELAVPAMPYSWGALKRVAW